MKASQNPYELLKPLLISDYSGILKAHLEEELNRKVESLKYCREDELGRHQGYVQALDSLLKHWSTLKAEREPGAS